MLRHMRAAWAFFLSLALVSPRHASAAPERVTYALGWTRMPGTESCMSAGELARTVEKRISNSAWAAASVADVQLEGYVERRAGSYHAHVKLTSKSGAILGERDLENEDPTCGPLDQAVTLMLALVLDPSLLS